MKDTYRTLTAASTGDFRDRASKFLAYAYRAYSIKEAKAHLEVVKKLHPKARHFCFAYRFGTDGTQFRANDDGEPSGSAGRPILGQIDSFGLSNVMVIVVRYFGGTKLGVPGLINAYKQATIDAFNNAEMEERTVDNIYQLDFSYAVMSSVMNWVKKADLNVIEQDFGHVPVLKVAVRQREVDAFLEGAAGVEGLEVEFLETR